jgi:hypothetical protein
VSIAGPAQREAREFYRRTQLPVLAWSPLGSGFLTSEQAQGGIHGSPANLARRQRLRAMARERGCTPAQLALAYLLHQPFPVSAVVAAKTVDKMRANLDAHGAAMTSEPLMAVLAARIGKHSAHDAVYAAAMAARDSGTDLGEQLVAEGLLTAQASGPDARGHAGRGRDYGSFVTNRAKQLYRHLVSQAGDPEEPPTYWATNPDFFPVDVANPPHALKQAVPVDPLAARGRSFAGLGCGDAPSDFDFKAASQRLRARWPISMELAPTTRSVALPRRGVRRVADPRQRLSSRGR